MTTEGTPIEWTHRPGTRGETWNPVVGCDIVSPGCTNCYAMKMAGRIERMGGAAHYAGTTKRVNGKDVWTGTVRAAPDHILTLPLRWKSPRTIFVNSMSDLFHEDLSEETIDRIFAVMALCPQHTFIILTKRAERMREHLQGERDRRIGGAVVDFAIAGKAMMKRLVRDVDTTWPVVSEGDPDWPDGLRLRNWPLPNVWLGVSVEDQRRADERIPHLLATPAAIRWISAEPLLGLTDITPWLFIFTHEDEKMLGESPASEPPVLPWRDPLTTPPAEIATPRLDWVVAGGESGPGARPMHPDWARALRNQCAEAEVPFFFKQWGNWRPAKSDDAFDTSKGRMASPPAFIVATDGTVHCFESDRTVGSATMLGVGKKAAGRHLDGELHNAFPEARP